MSGYLANLLRRSFDPSVALIQPRLNALFAPPEKRPWPALQTTTHESEPVVERTSADGSVPALDATLPRPTTRATGPTLTNQIAAPLTSTLSAGSTPDSPDMSLRPVAGEYREHPDALTATPTRDRQPESTVGSSELRELRLRDSKPRQSKVRESSAPVRATAAAPTGAERLPSPVVIARPSREKKATARERGEPSPRLAPATSTARAPATASSGRSIEPDLARPAEANVRDAAPTVSGNAEPPAVNRESGKVWPAFPLRSAENREATRSAEPAFGESTLAESKFAREPFLLRPAHFRELGRREPEPNAPPEPTIEVTIGRIEVRGAAPAEPRRVAAQPARGESLEEYLRRRAGRSRE